MAWVGQDFEKRPEEPDSAWASEFLSDFIKKLSVPDDTAVEVELQGDESEAFWDCFE